MVQCRKRVYILNMVKRIIIGLAVVFVLLVGAVLILPGLVPTDTYRTKLEADLSRAFARNVTITGDIKISTLPVIKVETGSISLANPEGFPEGKFVDVEAMSAKVKLWPLLSKRVEISGVTLKSPSIRLEKRADGRVNWVGKEVEEPVEKGPFKRDGRFTEYDPALALLSIEDGTVVYIDAAAGENIKIEKINLDLRAPGLAKPLRLNGDFLYDGMNTTIDAGIDSPADFLNGLKTGVSADVKTDEGAFEFKGQFLEGKDIALAGKFDAGSENLIALAEHLPLPDDLTLPALSSVSAKGDVEYGPTLTKFSALDVVAKGAGLDAKYNGSLDLTDGVKTAGKFSAKLDDLNIIKPYLEEPIEALDMISAVTAEGEVEYSPEYIKFPALDFVAKGSGVNAGFNGRIDLTEGAKSSGKFSAELDDMTLIEPFLDEPVQALDVVDAVNAQGNVEWTGKIFTLTDIETAVTGSDLTANFKGNAAFNKTLSLNGTFDGATPDVASLVKKAGLDQPDAAAMKRLSAKGEIALMDGKATVSNLTAEASEGHLNGNYNGDLTYGETLGLNGQFSGEISDLGALDAALLREIPYSDVAKRIKIASQIQSQGDGYTFSGLSAELQEGLLNGDFKGRLKVGDASDISGALTVSADSLRRIATSQNVILPTSTEVGAIFERFALSGQVSGTPERMSFSNGSINLDSLSGKGDFVMEMRNSKPELTGVLALSPLDLRPYMAAWSEQNPTGAIQPWSDDPISISGLESMNARVDITTPSIIMDRIKLGDTKGQVVLRNGTLTADLDKTKLYGGDATGKFSLTSQNGVPAIAIDATIKSVTARNFFAASGGFDKITGTSDLKMSFTGSGQSQADIMKSLTGDGLFKVIKGQLLGLDADSLLTGVEQAITSRALPSQGMGLGGTTEFNDIDSRFSLTNGRATLSGFQLKSGAFVMDADGSIDIGQQTIDIGIRPKLTGTSELASYGVPLRFTGGFGQAKATLDTNFLGDIAEAKARDKASSLIQDKLGDSAVGNILSGVIGGDKSPATPTAPTIVGGTEPTVTSDESATPETEQPKKEPETLEDVGENLLKGLFGKKKKNENTE